MRLPLCRPAAPVIGAGRLGQTHPGCTPGPSVGGPAGRPAAGRHQLSAEFPRAAASGGEARAALGGPPSAISSNAEPAATALREIAPFRHAIASATPGGPFRVLDSQRFRSALLFCTPPAAATTTTAAATWGVWGLCCLLLAATARLGMEPVGRL
jgi:hypothetical protein